MFEAKKRGRNEIFNDFETVALRRGGSSDQPVNMKAVSSTNLCLSGCFERYDAGVTTVYNPMNITLTMKGTKSTAADKHPKYNISAHRK